MGSSPSRKEKEKVQETSIVLPEKSSSVPANGYTMSQNSSNTAAVNEEEDSNNLINTIKTIKVEKHKRTEEGYVTSAFRKSSLFLLEILSEIIQCNTQKEKNILLQKLTDNCIKNKIIHIFCKVCTELSRHSTSYGEIPEQSEPLSTILSFLVNSSDANETMCAAIANESGFLQHLTNLLKEWIEPNNKEALDKAMDSGILDLVFTVVHNVAMFEDNVETLRGTGLIDTIKPYLDYDEQTIRLLCLATLADIINESESSILRSGGDGIAFLIWIIKIAMERPGRTCDGWSLKELVRIVRQVARNDSNKRTVVQHGAVPMLIQITESKDTEEQAAIITNVSQNDGDKNVDIERHIMISYNWGNQSIVKQICSYLRQNGLKVWMDVDDMQGSTLQAMASAVEKADIVLLCYSFKYKNSDNCRAEAEYAFQLKKKIVPLKMEKDYKADGWLGFIIGSKLFFDFSGKYPFENKVTDLVREVKVQQNKGKGTVVVAVPDKPVHIQEEPIVRTIAPASSGALPPKSKTNSVHLIRKWKTDQVEKWLDNNNLPKKFLGRLRGKDVAFFYILIQESPATFYQMVRDQLGIKDIQTTSDLRFALEDLDIVNESTSSL